ncbi:AAA family ATPase [Fusobacterium sp. PH5-44]|uniref:AAA family ATPase n=1 Tax=unclassified Fusobacterium TaxID=2648384 RepID=UPI003D19D4B5
MLIKFSVENFKNFEKKLEVDFTKVNNYSFNSEAIKNKVVNKGLIYGINGSGKSNLGFAIFDIISHVTDNEGKPGYYEYYLNGDSEKEYAEFIYEFSFDNTEVKYHYRKSDYDTLEYEALYIKNHLVLEFDRKNNKEALIKLEGTENLNRAFGDSKLSLVKYVKNNTLYSKESPIGQFFSFVDGMLWFRSVEGNGYIGYMNGTRDLNEVIIEKDLVNKFEEFLYEAGIKNELGIMKSGKREELTCKFKYEDIPLNKIASSGTKSLWLLYHWLQEMEKGIMFLFIDEFDAFYHPNLSKKIIEILKKYEKFQTFLTTHSPYLMNNELLRPDCYFILKDNKLISLSESTDKELREAHNIEKMYRAGAFD